MGYLSMPEVIQGRTEMFKLINGDVVFPLREWPLAVQLLFWKKPLTDGGGFKLMLFLIQNGLAPKLSAEWVMLSQFWTYDHKKMEKQARHANFILGNLDAKKREWFYYDLIHRRLMYLSGDIKQLRPGEGEKKEKGRKKLQKLQKTPQTAPLGATKSHKSNDQHESRL